MRPRTVSSKDLVGVGVRGRLRSVAHHFTRTLWSIKKNFSSSSSFSHLAGKELGIKLSHHCQSALSTWGVLSVHGEVIQSSGLPGTSAVDSTSWRMQAKSSQGKSLGNALDIKLVGMVTDVWFIIMLYNLRCATYMFCFYQIFKIKSTFIIWSKILMDSEVIQEWKPQKNTFRHARIQGI